MASVVNRFISVVVITLDFDRGITFQQPRFEPGMDLAFLAPAVSLTLMFANSGEACNQDCTEKRLCSDEFVVRHLERVQLRVGFLKHS